MPDHTESPDLTYNASPVAPIPGLLWNGLQVHATLTAADAVRFTLARDLRRQLAPRTRCQDPMLSITWQIIPLLASWSELPAPQRLDRFAVLHWSPSGWHLTHLILVVDGRGLDCGPGMVVALVEEERE